MFHVHSQHVYTVYMLPSFDVLPVYAFVLPVYTFVCPCTGVLYIRAVMQNSVLENAKLLQV